LRSIAGSVEKIANVEPGESLDLQSGAPVGPKAQEPRPETPATTTASPVKERVHA
jgi:hypothetical protein